MKRIMIVLAAVAMAFSANAQQDGFDNYAGLTLGGGWNTMTFSPVQGNQSIGLGFDAGLHYTHFFGKEFGLGFGIHYTYANAYAKYNFVEVTNGLIHTDNTNASYTLNTSFNNWKERQTVGVLGIPIEFFYRSIQSERWTFIGGLGVQFDLPLHGTYGSTSGEFSTSGTFTSLGSYAITDMPEHGFSTYDNTFTSKIDNLALEVSVIADLGFRMALKNSWGLYFGIYGGYGISNMQKEQKEDALLVVNTANPSQIQYNGTFGSNEIKSLHMLRAGIKVGVDFGWDDKSTIARRVAEQEAAERAAAEAAAAKAAAERAAAEKAAAEAAAAKAAAERAAEKAAAEKAAADRAAAERAAAQAAAEREAAERAAAKAAADRAASEAAAAQAAAERAAAEKAEAEHRALIERTRAEAEQKIKEINATVYFETAGTNAKFDALTDNAIHAICEALKADENLTVTVYGHTDNTGSLQVNMKYGQKRAEALKAYMVKLGAPAKSINCVSRGPNEPVADNDTESGRAKNRRATVELK